MAWHGCGHSEHFGSENEVKRYIFLSDLIHNLQTQFALLSNSIRFWGDNEEN